MSVMGTTARSGATWLAGLDADSAARKAAESLGQLRGLAAKVGQMASYVDGVIPEGPSESYQRWMKTLEDNAPRSSSKDVQALIEAQLGQSTETLFSAWDATPWRAHRLVRFIERLCMTAEP